MTHRTIRFSFSLLVIALAALSTPAAMAPSADAQAPALSGTWRLASDPMQAQATVSQSVEPALVALRPDLQQYARSRIAETTWIPSTITIAATPARISVDLQGAEHRTFDTPPNQAQNVYSRSGVRASLTQSLRPDGGVQQTFVAMDGTQWNVFVPDPSGQRMVLDVTLRSPRFTQDIHFQLVYVRAG
jgi:hypothetical protein